MIYYFLGVLTGLVLAILNMLFYKTEVPQIVEKRLKSLSQQKATIIEPSILDNIDV